jgi:hypothetical protein
MKKSQNYYSEGNDSSLIIAVRKSPVAIRIILMIVFVLFIIAPVATTVVVVNSGKGLNFGIAVMYFIFWLVGFYVLRLALWNSFGKEVLTFTQDSIIYEADYKLFKDGKIMIENKDIQINIVENKHRNENTGTLTLKSSSGKIETVSRLPISVLTELKEKICTRIGIKPINE